MSRLAMSLLIGSICLSSGCYCIMDRIDACEMGVKSRANAHWSWLDAQECYDQDDLYWDIKTGYLAGYQSAAGGGGTCQPPLPPRCYWKVQFQSPEGQARIQAWFDGYTHGALAATSEGMNSYATVPLAPQVYAAFDRERQQRELYCNPDAVGYDMPGLMPEPGDQPYCPTCPTGGVSSPAILPPVAHDNLPPVDSGEYLQF